MISISTYESEVKSLLPCMHGGIIKAFIIKSPLYLLAPTHDDGQCINVYNNIIREKRFTSSQHKTKNKD